jgi:hypothetical protein
MPPTPWQRIDRHTTKLWPATDVQHSKATINLNRDVGVIFDIAIQYALGVYLKFVSRRYVTYSLSSPCMYILGVQQEYEFDLKAY